MTRKRKSQPITLQQVFIMDPAYPLRQIVEREVMIVVGDKCTWAEHANGKRHLVGTSVFFTLPSAERAKRGALVKIVENGALRCMPLTHDMWARADHQLQLFEKTGSFTYKRKPN